MNLPNKLTVARIAATPLVVVLMPVGSAFTDGLATALFILACLTDLVDGWLARKWDQVTTMGKFMDPLADKLLVGSVLIMLVGQGRIPAWVAVLIVAREMAVTGMRAVAAERGVVVAADRYGKLKTITQIVALSPLVWGRDIFGLDALFWGQLILYVALAITLFSGGNYLYNFYKNLLKNP
ncbi:MAG: CDP-diacylglycerol--glycerol-3-phosphate 3-phosphatidyltransferase [Desulfovibrionaceae bacterium]